MSEKIPAKSVRTILDGTTGQLQSLVESCAHLEQVAKLVAGYLPEPLVRHCRVVNLANGVLTLYSDAPAWTTRLRFQGPHLLECLRGHPDLGQLREIRIKPEPASPVRTFPSLQTLHLPAAVADHLQAAALAISAPALRAALLRLARRG